MENRKLPVKQKAFCEYYVKTGGNISESARLAGYSKKTAGQIGHKLLKNVQIYQYIQELMKPIEAERIASAQEVAEFMTSVMRGEVNDQFGLDAPLSERSAAGRDLAKIHGMFIDRSKIEVSTVPTVLDDV